MNTSLVELNKRFAIPGKAEIHEGRGGLPCVRVSSSSASGEIYLHGGHVTSWSPNCGRDILFVSSQSEFKDGKAIRGGIPICFPWFGPKHDDKTAPSHGFVRTRSWKLTRIDASGTDVTVNMFYESNEETKRLWNFDFRIEHEVRFGGDLQCDLKVTNTGPTPFTFESAQHTYFRVGNIHQVAILGLEGTKYLDKVAAGHEMLQQDAITFSGETDRVYLNTLNAVTLLDPSLTQRCEVEKNGSRNTVVWNPWAEKARALPDFADQEYTYMVCIETANVGEGSVTLEPGAQHKMTSLYRVSES
ncbi:MAG TPA: D-hexose-6-phosphate mutarotase [Terriglobales bacterium]|nr:D-hexose-6-phosphate mutarotase [Terriglobales bacterium]